VQTIIDKLITQVNTISNRKTFMWSKIIILLALLLSLNAFYSSMYMRIRLLKFYKYSMTCLFIVTIVGMFLQITEFFPFEGILLEKTK